ncbi:MAG: HEAT repeat domain-containing protein [Candidatus Micrarchaeota archaeon]
MRYLKSKEAELHAARNYPKQAGRIPHKVREAAASDRAGARREAAVKLGRMDNAKAASLLLKLAEDDDWRVRGTSVHSLMNLHCYGKTRAIPREEIAEAVMRRLVSDASEYVRSAAAGHLPGIETQGGVFDACARLQAEPHSEVLCRLVSALGRCKDDYAIRFILPLVTHRHSAVRSSAVRALARLGAPARVDEAIALAGDASANARMTAVPILNRLHAEGGEVSKRARAALNRMAANDGNLKVRKQAAGALRMLKFKQQAARLSRL